MCEGIWLEYWDTLLEQSQSEFKDIIKKEHLTLTRDESAINESNERSGFHFRRCLLLECKVEYKLLKFQTLLKR